MKRSLAFGAAVMLLSACGASPAGLPPPSQSPSSPASPASSPVPSPSPSPSPTPTPPPQVKAGAPAYVAVSVATGWRSWKSPRRVDAPALENPVRIEAWLAGMTDADKVGLIGRIDTQLLLGGRVQVLNVSGEWAQVVVPDQATPLDKRGYPVYMPVRQLTGVSPLDAAEAVVVIKATTVLRSVDGARTLRISFGTGLSVLSEATATYDVATPGGVMVVDKSAVSIRKLPQTAASIVATARSFLGLQYLWGGTSGFAYDCSGLVYSVFKAHGLLLPRDADPQSRVGQAVSRAALQPGDLIFFSSGGVAYHVAIYAGQGLVIDSPSPGSPVEQVPLSTFPIIRDYSGARRVL